MRLTLCDLLSTSSLRRVRASLTTDPESAVERSSLNSRGRAPLLLALAGLRRDDATAARALAVISRTVSLSLRWRSRPGPAIVA
jgi:hypothetical protein